MTHMAILLAGGSGTRMGGMVGDKTLIEIAGRPLISHSLLAFAESKSVAGFVIVIRDNEQRKLIQKAVAQIGLQLPVLYTTGGKERSDSVRAGLDLLPSDTRFVYIHDVARPAVSAQSIRAVRKALENHLCATGLAHRCQDTLREFADNPLESAASGRCLDRSKLWHMETPQAFPRDLIEMAHANLKLAVTDDLAAIEALGKPILLVESLLPNPKLTRPADLPIIEAILNKSAMSNTHESPFRIGFGYDIHRLQKGRPLTLGGVLIPADVGLVGHSDADVLSHAIADAILGAVGCPDIGHYFPNTDASIAGINSQRILERAVQEAAGHGFKLINIDSSLIAETPRIAPYLQQMKATLSRTLQVPESAIGIKATTNERIGALGNAAGIAAQAVALVSR